MRDFEKVRRDVEALTTRLGPVLQHQAAQRAAETRRRQLDTQRRRKVVVRWDREALLWVVRCHRHGFTIVRATAHTWETAMLVAEFHVQRCHSGPLSYPVASVKP